MAKGDSHRSTDAREIRDVTTGKEKVGAANEKERKSK